MLTAIPTFHLKDNWADLWSIFDILCNSSGVLPMTTTAHCQQTSGQTAQYHETKARLVVCKWINPDQAETLFVKPGKDM